MKKYKKFITALILALICGIMPFISFAKVKALTVDDITTASDLKNTTWLFNDTLNLSSLASSTYLIVTEPTSEIVAYISDNQNIYNAYRYSSNGRIVSLGKVAGTVSYYTEPDASGSENLWAFGQWQFVSPPVKIQFLDFEFSESGDFIGWLKSNATLVNTEENIYKITFNLNGGTSEQPADIEFNTSITINKNTLPIPTRENYKFVYWAWADTDNIEYAEPFTQESLTFTDTDIYIWAIWTIYDVNMVFHLNNILILDARLIFTELEEPEEIAGEVIDKIAKIELIGDNVTTFKMIISTLSANPMLESSSPYISYILNYTNHVEIGFNFNSEYLNSISATSLYNVAEWTNIEQDSSFNDYLEIYINKPGQVIEVELESAKLVNDDIDNINTGANAVFNIITNFLNINIGFLTVGSIIAVLLAVAVLGFIIKIWQGGNNG